MLVLLLYLINFSRATIVYISNNLISKMRRQIEPNVDKADDKEQQCHVAEDDTSKSDKKRKTEEKSATTKGLNIIAADGSMSPKLRSQMARKKKAHNSSSDSPSSSSSSMSKRVGNTSKAANVKGTVTQNISFHMEENQNETNEILKFATPKDLPYYEMKSKRRGKCVIFNHMNFDEGNGDHRAGSDKDVDAITTTFKKLGFDIEVHDDKTYAEIVDIIAELSQEKYDDSDALCIFVLTHGCTNGRVNARDVAYPFLNIWDPFIECKSLTGKPKMFFVQACRGGMVEEGRRGRSVTDSDDSTYCIPTNADFLFGYSTVDGYYSWRHENKGSWYIQSLCKTIDEHSQTTDMLKILTITARKVAFEYTSKHEEQRMNAKTQMPTLSSTLTRDLYFVTPPHDF